VSAGHSRANASSSGLKAFTAILPIHYSKLCGET
jgi:hypothetical protein